MNTQARTRSAPATAAGRMKRKEYEEGVVKLHRALVKLPMWLTARKPKVCPLEKVPCEELPREKATLPKRQKPAGYVDPGYPCKFVKERY